MIILFDLRNNPDPETVASIASERVNKLILYNGSPRLSDSNTALILRAISEACGPNIVIRDLKHKKMWPQWASDFSAESAVIFVIPLYVHAMPSHVMNFIPYCPASNSELDSSAR